MCDTRKQTESHKERTGAGSSFHTHEPIFLHQNKKDNRPRRQLRVAKPTIIFKTCSPGFPFWLRGRHGLYIQLVSSVPFDQLFYSQKELPPSGMKKPGGTSLKGVMACKFLKRLADRIPQAARRKGGI